MAQREVAKLLQEGKEEKAAIKVEAIIRHVNRTSHERRRFCLGPVVGPFSPLMLIMRHPCLPPHHREDATIEALGIIELMCDLVHEVRGRWMRPSLVSAGWMVGTGLAGVVAHKA